MKNEIKNIIKSAKIYKQDLLKAQKNEIKINKFIELNKDNNLEISITKSNGKNLDWNDIDLLVFIFNRIDGNNIKRLNKHNITIKQFSKHLTAKINLNSLDQVK